MDLALQGWGHAVSFWKARKSQKNVGFSRKASLLPQTAEVFSLWYFLVWICQRILQVGHRSFKTFIVGMLLDDRFQLASLRHFQESLSPGAQTLEGPEAKAESHCHSNGMASWVHGTGISLRLITCLL